MKYNYVFFDGNCTNNLYKIKDDYYYICTEELRKYDNIKIVSYACDGYPLLFHYLYSLCVRLGKIIRKTKWIEKIWYPYFFKSNFDKNQPICFIVSGFYITPNYLRYLKESYKRCKIVKIYRDLFKLWRIRNPLFTDDDVKELFDFSFSYDREDTLMYNMEYFDEFESRIEVPSVCHFPLHGVFFCGAGKNRLDMLLSVYDYLSYNNIDCYFYITNVPKNQQISRTGIKYEDKNMTYREMLYHTVNSEVILEINQIGAIGYTSRFLESVIYNKKLLTNNKDILNSKFYNSNYIQYFDNAKEIDIKWMQNNEISVNYNYSGEFSPIKLIERIEKIL